MARYINTREKIKSYRRTFKRFGIDPKALQWRSEKAARLRYEQLVADMSFEGKDILDVGCGFGDIISYISKKTEKFSYTGCDVVPEFIKVAKKKYPKHKFIIRDYLEKPLKKSFDIIITSGTLNTNIKNAVDFRKRAIATMFENCGEALVFNMAGGYPQPKNKKGYKVYYVNSLDVLSYCLSLTSKLILRHHYHSKDFTVVMFKNL